MASIIFIDAPVGTGFSYSTTVEGANSSDTINAAQIYTFLRKVTSKFEFFYLKVLLKLRTDLCKL